MHPILSVSGVRDVQGYRVRVQGLEIPTFREQAGSKMRKLLEQCEDACSKATDDAEERRASRC